jgi:hypothetical protein
VADAAVPGRQTGKTQQADQTMRDELIVQSLKAVDGGIE